MGTPMTAAEHERRILAAAFTLSAATAQAERLPWPKRNAPQAVRAYREAWDGVAKAEEQLRRYVIEGMRRRPLVEREAA